MSITARLADRAAEASAREAVLLESLGARCMRAVEILLPGASDYVDAWVTADRLLLLDEAEIAALFDLIDTAVVDEADADRLGRIVFMLLPAGPAADATAEPAQLLGSLLPAELARRSERTADATARHYPDMLLMLDAERANAYAAALPALDARALDAWRVAWQLLHGHLGEAWDPLARFIDDAVSDDCHADAARLQRILLMLLPEPVAAAAAAAALAHHRSTSTAH